MKRSIWRKLFGSLFKLFVPAFLLILAVVIVSAILLVHNAAEPPRAAYLVTPDKLGEIIRNRMNITEETWQNKDTTGARGWLLHGQEKAPAVVLLHRYGTDRSWLLNLGVKLNEATGFTVLIPDQRGHGENPSVKWTSFGGGEAEDLLSAIEFLRTKKVVDRIGVYGVEMGAVAALFGAGADKSIQSLALDSVPGSSEDVLESVVKSRSSYAGEFAYQIACRGTHLYYRNAFRHDSLCDAAKSLDNRRVLLLGGKDALKLQETTLELKNCLGASNVEAKTDLQVSGYSLVNMASSQQQEEYNRLVIDFFRQTLSF